MNRLRTSIADRCCTANVAAWIGCISASKGNGGAAGRYRPAQDRGGGRASGEAGGTEVLDQPAASGKQENFGDDALGDQQPDDDVADAMRAPEQGGEAVIRGMRALDERGAANRQAKGLAAEQPEPSEGVRGDGGRCCLRQKSAE
jgi:hypothetical protein